MDPWVVYETWTHRRVLVTLEWLDEQWNNPSRSDHYILENTAEVRRSWVKNPKRVKSKSFIIKFVREGEERDKADKGGVSQKTASIWAETKWVTFVGGNVTRRIKHPDGRIEYVQSEHSGNTETCNLPRKEGGEETVQGNG